MSQQAAFCEGGSNSSVQIVQAYIHKFKSSHLVTMIDSLTILLVERERELHSALIHFLFDTKTYSRVIVTYDVVIKNETEHNSFARSFPKV